MLRPALRRRRWRTLAGVLAALLAAPAVAVGSASAAQADAVRQQELWVLNAINVAGAWQHTHGSGVTVALIDSGVNGQVSDLNGSVTTGRDFSGVNTPPTDTNWGVHGTWMASLIVGHGHAGGSSGIMGVAPDAKILSIRAVTDQGDPGYHHYQHESESRVQGHLAEAIKYATSKRVSVISMSLGYQGASLPVRVAISKALAQGIVVVASSGNSGGASSGSHGNAPYSFPADYPGVLGVGAVAQNGLPAGFSSDNLSVQVAAPGVRVPAQGRDGQYWLVSGTSPACALTAGVAALIKSVYPALTPALVAQAITASTRNKPHGGYDEEVGFGTVDATAAVRMAGRLARNQSTGPSKVATVQFGGGPAAIPAVPVAPRTNRQFLLDSGIALMCLAVVLILVFRLIVTRRPTRALAGVPGGVGGGAWAAGGAPGSWAAGGTPGNWAAGEAPGGWAAGGAPGGWAGAGPSAAAPPNPGPPNPGPSDPGLPGPSAPIPGVAGAGVQGTDAAGAGGAWPNGQGAGYGRPAAYWAPGGYKPSAGYPAPPGYGSPGESQYADPGPPAEYRSTEDYLRPPGSTGYGTAGSFQPSADSGAPPSSGLSGSVWPAGSGELPGYGAPPGSGEPAGYGVPPGTPAAPVGYGHFEDAAGTSTDPGTGYPELTEPQDAGSRPGRPARGRRRHLAQLRFMVTGRPPDFAERVLGVTESIPPGRVMSYGDIAEYLGEAGPRQVGRVMSQWGGGVAWWRVIHADGSFLAGHEREALARYLEEGTPLRRAPDGEVRGVDMRRARWLAPDC